MILGVAPAAGPDDAINGALLGAGITGLVAVLLFIAERIASRVSLYRERRRVAFGEIITAFNEYAGAAIRELTYPTGSVEAELLSTQGKMLLALGDRSRTLGWWITGMQKRLRDSAAPVVNEGQGQEEFFESQLERQQQIEQLMANVMNTLVDVQHRRLTVRDFLMPAGLFWAEAQGVNVSEEYPDEVLAALRPRPMGKRKAAWETFMQFWAMLWIGFRRLGRRTERLEWVPDDIRAAAAREGTDVDRDVVAPSDRG